MNPLLIDAEGGIVTLTLNLPEQRNPISDPAMIDALTAALAGLNEDPSVRVAILTGAGLGFSSGGNVKAMAGAAGRAASSPHASSASTNLAALSKKHAPQKIGC